MKKMKCGIYAALAAVLLLTAVLVISCPEILTPGDLTSSDKNQPGGFVPPDKGQPEPFVPPPDGKSYLSLNFGNSNGRTIMPPSIANIGAANFVAFVVNIANTTDVSDKPVEDQIIQAVTTPTAKTALQNLLDTVFEVTNGQTYTVTVNAYQTFSSIVSSTVVATGAGTVAASGTSNPVEIALATIKTGPGTGTFQWNLQYNTTGDFDALDTGSVGTPSALMSFTQITGGAAHSSINLFDDPSDTTGISMTAGVYRVSIALASDMTIDADGEEYQPETREWVLHIYQGMTSLFQEDLKPLGNVVHEVTFVNDDGASNDTVAKYKFGELLNTIAANTPGTNGRYPYNEEDDPIGDPGVYVTIDPVHDDTTTAFVAWYTEDGSGSPSTWDTDYEVNLSTYRVFRDQSLYARWVETADANIYPFTFEMLDLAANVTTVTSTITQDDFMENGLTLTVTGAPAGATYSWRYNGSVPTAGASGTSTATVLIRYIAANTATHIYIQPRIHRYSLDVIVGGVTYSKNFDITVTQ